MGPMQKRVITRLIGSVCCNLDLIIVLFSPYLIDPMNNPHLPLDTSLNTQKATNSLVFFSYSFMKDI